MEAILNSITFLQLCISLTIGNGKGYQTAAKSVTGKGRRRREGKVK